MTNEEKLAQVRRKLEQVLNELPTASGVAPAIVDEKTTYETIAAKLDRVITSLANLNESMGLQAENRNEA